MTELNFKDLRVFSTSFNTLLTSIETARVICQTIPQRTEDMRHKYPNMSKWKIDETMQDELTKFLQGVRADYDTAVMWGRECGVLLPFCLIDVMAFIRAK